MTAAEEDRQTDDWEDLYARARALLQALGAEDAHAKGDFFVLDDNWGTKELRVEINNLALLRPSVVKSLQGLLRDLPAWKIVVAVDVPGTEARWPEMGLVIRKDDIVDGLQRSFFPAEFRDIQYDGSRPGTDRD
jgi:hypothetical protein